MPTIVDASDAHRAIMAGTPPPEVAQTSDTNVLTLYADWRAWAQTHRSAEEQAVVDTAFQAAITGRQLCPWCGAPTIICPELADHGRRHRASETTWRRNGGA